MAAEIKFDILPLKELEELNKQINKLIKEKKAEVEALEKHNREENAEYARNTLKVEDKIVFKYKEETSVGVIQKLNAKTFTVAFSIDGEDKVLIRAYHLFVRFAGEADRAA